jgi:hypothetical protein
MAGWLVGVHTRDLDHGRHGNPADQRDERDAPQPHPTSKTPDKHRPNPLVNRVKGGS